MKEENSLNAKMSLTNLELLADFMTIFQIVDMHNSSFRQILMKNSNQQGKAYLGKNLLDIKNT